MKPRISPLVPFAALLLLGACQTSASHWDPEFASEQASFQFIGANSQTSESISQTTRGNSESMTLTMRRYFFNDNPENPLQHHRNDPADRYVPIWDMPVNAVLDTGEMLGVAGARAGQGAWGLILMPWQLLAGTPKGESYREPPPPSEFDAK